MIRFDSARIRSEYSAVMLLHVAHSFSDPEFVSIRH